jgi:hypothetical protein
MVCPLIDNPARCKIQAVIHFLHSKNMSDVEIHHELCMVVYGQNVISKGIVECSKTGEQMFTMMGEVVCHL